MPRNSAILNAPVILFLGAGASVPLGKPTMVQFVRRLSKRINDGLEKTVLNILAKLRAEDLETILEDLDAIIGLDYVTSVQGWDYEKIFATHSFPGYSPSPEPTPPSKSQVREFTITASTAKQLRERIEKEVIKEYRNVSSQKTQILYEPLLDRIFSHVDPNKHCLPVFTTNYDRSMEVFFSLQHDRYAIVDGFKEDLASREYYWDSGVFDEFQLVPSKRNLVLFKLHGSVDWLHVKAADRIIRAQAIRVETGEDEYANRLIYPAKRKVAIEEPYFTAYDYYGRCSENSKFCLTIGYSFRDYDALTRLKAAIRANPQFRLALISPEASNILNGLPFHPSRRTAIDMRFGEGEDIESYLKPLDIYL